MAITTTRPTGTVRLKFTGNVCYNGVDYGPDYPKDVANVEAFWARQFIRRGKAVAIASDDPKKGK